MKSLYCVLTLLMLGSFVIAQRPAMDSTVKKKTPLIQYGIASFYSNKFEGKMTANGEVFSQDSMTCAHNTLSFGTWIKVTNLRNGKSVKVRVTDRLHYKNTRLVDLSRTAASKLGYVGRGITRVKVQVLGRKRGK